MDILGFSIIDGPTIVETVMGTGVVGSDRIVIEARIGLLHQRNQSRKILQLQYWLIRRPLELRTRILCS